MASDSMPAGASRDLTTQVARLFFDRQLSKVEIASRLGISRFRVARLIAGALADGSVRIEYRDTPADDRALAAALEIRFGLDLCAVASGGRTELDPGADPVGPNAGDRAARLAADVLDGLIGRDDRVGIAWGSTLAAVARAIPPRHEPGLEIVQLAGSSQRLPRERDAGEVSRALADRLGATHRAIFAPAFVESVAVRDALLREPEIAATAARYRGLTLALVGIGAMPDHPSRDDASSSLVRAGVLAPADIETLTSAGAVGDLVVHPFDGAGRFVAPDVSDRAMAIGIDELRDVRRVMAIAAGTTKATAILGALRTGIVSMLVTDAPTARAVLASA